MQISNVQVKNLRCLRDVALSVDPLIALIGANNTGKSTILKAIEFFFEAAPKLDKEDFTSGHGESPIEITITFCNLTPDELTEFGSAVIDGEMVVTRTLSLTERDSGQYSVQALSYPGFREIRAETNGTRKRSAYNALARETEGLETVSSHTEVETALREWENKNPDKLILEKRRDFFGAPNVANGKLRKKTGVHLVPAVRDAAAETSDPRRSPIISLLNEIARQTFENRREIAEFVKRTEKEFEELADPSRVPELATIGETLTASIRKFYDDSKLDAHWEQGQGVSVSYPAPRIIVNHDGIITELARVGHGLQRAALFAIVQFLAEQQAENTESSKDKFDDAASDIVLLVEEPEIYQHPSKQLVIFDVFKDLTSYFNKSTGIRVQIIYTTHSEKFVRMSDFDIARIIRRSGQGESIQNSVNSLTIGVCSKAFANYFEPPKNPMSDEAFSAKLHIFTREVCEGFFADKVILVEGVVDRAILEAIYQLKGRDIHRESIAVVSVEGKTKLDKPAYIFWNLNIPTYIIMDNDKSENKNSWPNVLLQKICQVESPEEWPDGCFDRFAAFDGNIEKYMKERMGSLFDSLFQEVAKEFGLSVVDINKTPAALLSVFNGACSQGITFPMFDQIVEKVDALKID